MLDSNYISLIGAFNTYPNKYKLTFEDYKLILKTFFYILKEEMIYKGKVFILPKRLGTLGVKKFKQIGPGVMDYQHFRKTGERRRLKNLHSEQFIATIHWDKSYRRFNDIISCTFKFFSARPFARELAKHIKEDNAISKYYDK